MFSVLIFSMDFLLLWTSVILLKVICVKVVFTLFNSCYQFCKYVYVLSVAINLVFSFKRFRAFSYLYVVVPAVDISLKIVLLYRVVDFPFCHSLLLFGHCNADLQRHKLGFICLNSIWKHSYKSQQSLFGLSNFFFLPLHERVHGKEANMR